MGFERIGKSRYHGLTMVRRTPTDREILGPEG
jgi:hypothetical protein